MLLIVKSHVRAHTRTLASGKVVQVVAHEDKRRAIIPAAKPKEQADLFEPPTSTHPTGSPAFQRWFGDSKVVDADGAPKVVYHGTQVWEHEGRSLGDFDQFDRMASVNVVGRKPSIDNVGSWFDESPAPDSGAGMYAGSSGAVYPVYLSIKDPWVGSFTLLLEAFHLAAGRGGVFEQPYPPQNGGAEPLRDWLISEGYDGLRIEGGIDRKGQGTVWVALHPEQIKSAISNSGAFDPLSPNMMKALQAGERWITVHPHGKDEKGQPILVQPQQDGSMKVVGGAGGKLNHLRLTGVRPQGELAQTMKDRAEERKAKAKRMKERDKALGLQQSKKEATAKVGEAKREAQRQFVKAVASTVGWKPEDITFDENATAGKPDHVANKMREQHLGAMVKRAQEVVNLNRERLLSDHAAQAETSLGEIPLETQDPDKLSVEDIDPIAESVRGPGFKTDYAGRAEAAGADIKAEAKEFKKELSPEQRKAAIRNGETAALVREGMELLREPDGMDALAPKIVDAQKALELLKLDKKRKLAEQQAKAAKKEIAESIEAPKAFVIETDDATVDQKVAEEVAADLRTISTRAFLSEVAKHSVDPVKDLGRHIGVGAFNSINSLALAAGGAGLVDRSVVDVLGIAGAAEVLARRLASDLTPEEYDDVAEGMKDFHLHHYMEATEEAIGRAHELEQAAAEMQLGEAENGDDLAALQEINRRRKQALSEVNQVLGTALGETEANAALVFALGRGRQDKPFEVNLGEVAMESAIAQVRAIGLQRGDFSIETISGNRVLKVQPAGLDRLAAPVSREDLTQVRRNLDIIEGAQDEDGWLPEGITDRPDLDLRPKAGAAPTLAQPFEPGPDLEGSVSDYIGGRMADGDNPADIVADLQSLPMIQKAGDRADAYRAALDKLAPLTDADGKMRQPETLRDSFEAMADRFVEAKYGGGGKHRVSISESGESFDAPSHEAALDWLSKKTGVDRQEIEDSGDWADDDLFIGGEGEHEFSIEPPPKGASGPTRTPIARQTFPIDDVAKEALHRALAASPSGVAAYKPVGELTPQDQAGLREHFAKEVAKETPEATRARHELETLAAREPPKTVEDMFGEQATNPEWSDWRARRDDLRTQVAGGVITWPKYVEAMRSPERAYAAIQDLVRCGVNETFAKTYNTLRPDKPLAIGRATIRENLNHLDAVDPAARAARMAKEAALTDSLRNRQGGRYAPGAVSDKLDAAREEEAGLSAAQMGLFGEPDEPDRDEHPLAADERYYLGHAAERQLAALAPEVGKNFRPGQPVKLFRPTMSGGANWARQRAVKLIDANKRVVLSFGTGSGKTMIGLGAFTHLHAQGKAKRGLFLVPSIAQGGFQAEALRFLKPDTYQWHAKPGASQAERLAAYKDPANNFAVMTHQSFRDDMLHLGAQHAGVSEQEMSGQLAAMDPAGRQEWLKGVMRREGINFDYLNVDEGHDTLNRKGKENSALANVVDALGSHVPYYVSASADPVKNDVSEAFSLLQKMDPARYTDQAAFMRKYGVNSAASQDELRRELARFQYPSKIDPDITATRSEVPVDISDGQKKALADLDGHVAAARLARMQGKVDVAAIKALSPASFEGAADDQHEAIAAELTKNLGLIKETAVRHVLEASADGHDVQTVVDKASERRGKPGVVFAHSLAAVETLRKRLAAEGFRVATITGKDSAKEKAKRIDGFNPQAGDADHDILVCSDAGATGANLQSGRYVINFDTPETAKTHAQRNGRVNRIGQTKDVELMDIVRKHPAETRRRDRLKRKYALREALTTPMESLDDTGVAHFLRRREVARENGGLL